MALKHHCIRPEKPTPYGTPLRSYINLYTDKYLRISYKNSLTKWDWHLRVGTPFQYSMFRMFPSLGRMGRTDPAPPFPAAPCTRRDSRHLRALGSSFPSSPKLGMAFHATQGWICILNTNSPDGIHPNGATSAKEIGAGEVGGAGWRWLNDWNGELRQLVQMIQL